jgi:plasmid stabilization system protein ParE
MALELRRLPQAQRVALDIWLYVAADNVSATDRLLERIDSAAWELSNQPMSGRAGQTGGWYSKLSDWELRNFLSADCCPSRSSAF